MNTEQYISSGILEAYAMGDVSAIEREEVEKNLKQYPQLEVELELIERTMEQLAMSAAIQPKASVKEAIFSQIDTPATKVIAFTSNSIWRYATAASIAFALFASYMAYHYYNRWEMTSVALTDLMAQNQQIAQDYNVVNEKLDKIQDDFSIIENAAFTKVVMNGTENSPESLVSVYWNPNSKEVYLSIQKLKELSGANQFQLWAIVDGKPVDAGVFDSNTEGLIRMKSISGAAAFAVTIEPRGGNLSPSLETMQVMGGLSKG